MGPFTAPLTGKMVLDHFCFLPIKACPLQSPHALRDDRETSERQLLKGPRMANAVEHRYTSQPGIPSLGRRTHSRARSVIIALSIVFFTTPLVVSTQAHAGWLGLPKHDNKSIVITEARGALAPVETGTKKNLKQLKKLNGKSRASRSAKSRSRRNDPNLMASNGESSSSVTHASYSEVRRNEDGSSSAMTTSEVDSTLQVAIPSSQPRKHIANFRMFPVSMLIRSTSMDVNFPLSETFSLGPALMHNEIDLGFVGERSMNLGARAAWYPSGVFNDSFYLSSQLMHGWGKAKFELGVIGGESGFNRTALTLLGGYQWHWQNFNLSLALGVYGSAIRLKSGSGHILGYRGTFADNTESSSAGGYSGEFSLGFSF